MNFLSFKGANGSITMGYYINLKDLMKNDSNIKPVLWLNNRVEIPENWNSAVLHKFQIDNSFLGMGPDGLEKRAGTKLPSGSFEFASDNLYTSFGFNTINLNYTDTSNCYNISFYFVYDDDEYIGYLNNYPVSNLSDYLISYFNLSLEESNKIKLLGIKKYEEDLNNSSLIFINSLAKSKKDIYDIDLSIINPIYNGVEQLPSVLIPDDVKNIVLYNQPVQQVNHSETGWNVEFRIDSTHIDAINYNTVLKRRLTWNIDKKLASDLKCGIYYDNTKYLLDNGSYTQDYSGTPITPKAWLFMKVEIDSKPYFWNSSVYTYYEISGNYIIETPDINKVNDKDYYIILDTKNEYYNNINPNENAIVKLTSKTNYEGSYDLVFKIIPSNIENIMLNTDDINIYKCGFNYYIDEIIDWKTYFNIDNIDKKITYEYLSNGAIVNSNVLDINSLDNQIRFIGDGVYYNGSISIHINVIDTYNLHDCILYKDLNYTGQTANPILEKANIGPYYYNDKIDFISLKNGEQNIQVKDNYELLLYLANEDNLFEKVSTVDNSNIIKYYFRDNNNNFIPLSNQSNNINIYDNNIYRVNYRLAILKEYLSNPVNSIVKYNVIKLDLSLLSNNLLTSGLYWQDNFDLLKQNIAKKLNLDINYINIEFYDNLKNELEKIPTVGEYIPFILIKPNDIPNNPYSNQKEYNHVNIVSLISDDLDEILNDNNYKLRAKVSYDNKTFVYDIDAINNILLVPYCGFRYSIGIYDLDGNEYKPNGWKWEIVTNNDDYVNVTKNYLSFQLIIQGNYFLQKYYTNFFKIFQKNIDYSDFNFLTQYNFTGNQVKLNFNTNLELNKDFEYNIIKGNGRSISRLEDNVVLVEGVGNYTGALRFNFEIISSIKNLRFLLDGKENESEWIYSYTGAQIKPKLTILTNPGDGIEPEEITTYELSYGNNISCNSVGSVYVKFNKGVWGANVEGKTLEFKIVPMSMDNLGIEIEDAYYTGESITPNILNLTYNNIDLDKSVLKPRIIFYKDKKCEEITQDLPLNAGEYYYRLAILQDGITYTSPKIFTVLKTDITQSGWNSYVPKEYLEYRGFIGSSASDLKIAFLPILTFNGVNIPYIAEKGNSEIWYNIIFNPNNGINAGEKGTYTLYIESDKRVDNYNTGNSYRKEYEFEILPYNISKAELVGDENSIILYRDGNVNKKLFEATKQSVENRDPSELDGFGATINKVTTTVPDEDGKIYNVTSTNWTVGGYNNFTGIISLKAGEENKVPYEDNFSDLDIESQDIVRMSGYTYLQYNSNDLGLFTISSQGKSAFDELTVQMFNHTHCAEQITINCLPIYQLQPNTRIYVYDEKVKINGEYLITKISVPLGHTGTMSITAAKVVKDLF